MQVSEITTYDQPLTDPSRNEFGITFALRGGDVCHPVGEGNWFSEPFFQKAIKFRTWFPCLPWLAWNLWGWQGYCGFKVYGVDSPTYVGFAGEENVYEGSQALHFSARFRMRS